MQGHQNRHPPDMIDSIAARAGARCLSAQQRKRRARIIEEAVTLAAAGYEAMHVRVVAKRADVAVATVYRYFPSKEHLLVCCLEHWLRTFERNARRNLVHGDDDYRRLLRLVDHLNATLCGMPRFADALARAYLFADAAAAPLVEDVRTQMINMMATAMGRGSSPTRHHLQVSELVSDVWAANVLALVHQRATIAEVQQRLAVTIDVIERRSPSR